MESLTGRTEPGAAGPPGAAGASGVQRLARHLVLRKLRALNQGTLEIEESFHPGGPRVARFGAAVEDGLAARVQILDAAFYPRIALTGSLGAAEAYMEGQWMADDLTAVIRLLVRNRQAMEGLDSGWGRLLKPLHKLYHLGRGNTRRGSRKNIEAHYDLGNDFFQLFLDETLMYSAAIFDPPEATLREASEEKVDRLCRKLALSPQDHVLEIGTGWGGFACHAAARYGCRVTTTTISPAQHSFAVQRVRAAGLEDRVTVLLKDYRDLEGEYDKLVSIEMIEAVGLEYLETFFQVCAVRLKPHGLMGLQAITIDDRLFSAYRRSVDFIQRYIFPGSGLPSLGAMAQATARVTDFSLVHLEDIGLHYARTLAEWRRRFLANLDAVRRQGFSDRFQRMWEFYLCYCEGGFLERSISDVQMILARPQARAALLGAPSP